MGASDDLQRMRVADLRDELARRSLDTGGLKAALVSRLAKALRSERRWSTVQPSALLWATATALPHCQQALHLVHVGAYLRHPAGALRRRTSS